MPLSPLFRTIGYETLPGWDADHLGSAFAAFRLCALKTRDYRYKTGALGVDAASFKPAFEDARSTPMLDDRSARAFFERHFLPCRIEPEGAPRGFVTGFYEPEVAASSCRTGEFSVPLLGIPDDLVKIDDTSRPCGLDPYLAFGRQTAAGLVEYHDRAAIENGAIKDRAKPIAWLTDRVDAFFIHVQGAARLAMPDGTLRRVTYAAKSGQRFTGPGRVLAQLGEIPAAEVTMQSIRAWVRANPHRLDEILQQNRSYIFFREAPVDDPTLGPVAAAKVPLTAGRSIAVDRLLHTFGTPIFVDAPTLDAFGEAAFRRLMVAQDTGSAIVGPARGDLFAGSGDAAGEIAGVVRHDADMVALLPRALVEGRG